MSRTRFGGRGVTGGHRHRASLVLPVPDGAGAVCRTVRDKSGNPVAGARVIVTSATSQRIIQGTTDPYGGFCALLPPGKYSLMISLDGLQPHNEILVITPGTEHPPGTVQMELAPPLPLPPPGNWVIDPPHTTIRFIAKHVGMANIHGCFTAFEGVVRLSRETEQSHVAVRIDASSIFTGNRTRDDHLRSADFLEVGKFPYIDFVSERFTHRQNTKWTVQGTLTLHGVSRTVALDTTYLGTVNGGYGEELRCAAFASTSLHREDFTLNWRKMLARGISVVGPTVRLELDIQAMFQS
ncbi:YceI family protein [Streptomyces acidicola]|uniref:YceI family protein n=1 Tax=Streptomyces acidicola TaxID=2596892 RepID=UPI00381D3D93